MSQYESIDENTFPETDLWAFPELYKTSKLGKESFWQISYKSGNIETSHGFSDGKIRTDNSNVETNNSGRSLIEQAYLQAKNKYEEKIRKDGYRPRGVILVDTDKQPMLCQKYLDQKKINWPMTAQPKLDGIRLMARLENGEVVLRTGRGNKPVKYLTGIRNDLYGLLERLPDNAILDGEAYSLDMTFNELAGAFKTEKFEHPKNRLIRYFIFDVIIYGLDFEDRYRTLVNEFDEYKYLELVPCENVGSHKEVMELHGKMVSEGYEGIILRDPKGMYQHGRSKAVLKHKDFFDEEGTVVDITEATGTEKGLALLVIKDDRGNVFPVRPRGTFESRKEYLQNKDKYIGKRYTFRFQELSEYGVPRMVVGVCFRDYE